MDTFSEDFFLDFSSRRWLVSDAPAGKSPGPNIFLPDNVYLDARERLVLRISQRNGSWSSAELHLTEALGYGRYEIIVEGDPAKLDPQAVFGFFTYDHLAPPLYRELDIEFARWADPGHPGGNYTVQPYTLEENKSVFPLEELGSRSLHRIEWMPDRVEFSSYALGRGGWEREVARFIWPGETVPDPGTAYLHLNFWLFRGAPPQSGEPQVLRVSEFTFTPFQN
ncbi:glycoside hydrolase family 16 protein [Marispirochaeta sp.]|uniref:glycoside hydrolase family 16 protein n=1 Tax=Marispirochaeta sp. TaxID=2038653 RepID=UPI0029C81F19|nr:glycoside hydrolase family 16 protein [Marispirochaeta sp.]